MTELNPSIATPPTPDPGPGRLTGARRAIASALLIAGLFAVGGTAVALAADPSASPGPSTSTQPSDDGSGGTTAPGSGTAPSGRAGRGDGDCPDKGTGSGGTDGSDGSSSTPATPTTPDSTATPAV